MSFPIDLILVPELDDVSASIEAGADEMDLLNALAEEGGAQPLDAFLSEAATLGDPDEIDDSELHDPADGLRTVAAILSGLAGRADLEDVVVELENLRDALTAAAKAGSRFCLSMDL